MGKKTETPGRVRWETTRHVEDLDVPPGEGTLTFSVKGPDFADGFKPNFCSLKWIDEATRAAPGELSYSITLNGGTGEYDVEVYYSNRGKGVRKARAVVARLYIDPLHTTLR